MRSRILKIVHYFKGEMIILAKVAMSRQPIVNNHLQAMGKSAGDFFFILRFNYICLCTVLEASALQKTRKYSKQPWEVVFFCVLFIRSHLKRCIRNRSGTRTQRSFDMILLEFVVFGYFREWQLNQVDELLICLIHIYMLRSFCRTSIQFKRTSIVIYSSEQLTTPAPIDIFCSALFILT